MLKMQLPFCFTLKKYCTQSKALALMSHAMLIRRDMKISQYLHKYLTEPYSHVPGQLVVLVAHASVVIVVIHQDHFGRWRCQFSLHQISHLLSGSLPLAAAVVPLPTRSRPPRWGHYHICSSQMSKFTFQWIRGGRKQSDMNGAQRSKKILLRK